MRFLSSGLCMAGVLLIQDCDRETMFGGPSSAASSTGADTARASPVAQVTRGDAVLAARQCGRTLGIAVRCNLIRDDRDFAVLRYTVLQGLSTRYAAVTSREDLADLVDFATLDRLTSLAACSIPAADVTRVETGVRGAVTGCSTP